MICNREDLKYYLLQDQKALGYESQRAPRWWTDEIWRFQILLRKSEYYTNCRKGILDKFMFGYYKFCFHRLSVKLGFSIPTNVFGPGLSIAHYGSIVVNDHAKVGRNCRIQENVTIGSTGGTAEAPQIGDNVFIASGARLIGDIRIGDQCAIGANAVVTKSFEEPQCTIAGVPAKVISKHGSDGFIRKSLN